MRADRPFDPINPDPPKPPPRPFVIWMDIEAPLAWIALKRASQNQN